MSSEPAPRQAPRAPPATSTAKVWPVMGTGVHGSLTAICAHRATNRANPTIRPGVHGQPRPGGVAPRTGDYRVDAVPEGDRWLPLSFLHAED